MEKTNRSTGILLKKIQINNRNATKKIKQKKKHSI